MRLVINATAYGDPPGGAGLRARHLFGELTEFDRLFLLAEDTPASVVPPGVETRRLPVRAGAPFRRWLGLRLPAEGDLLFTDHYPAGPVPTVITLHDTGLAWWRRRLIRRELQRAAAVVAVSEAVRDAWGVPAHVVRNGVAAPPASLPAPERHLLVCDPGLAHKGAATARAAARALGVELREVGRGARWLPQEEFYRELARAAVVLCPARDEGFGMVPLEAMAVGRPVVASDVPAHREVLGGHARYAAPGDVDAWAAATRAALEAPAATLDAAREHASGRSWARSADLLRELIAAIRPRAGSRSR